MKPSLLILALTIAVLVPAYSQTGFTTCVISAPSVPLINSTGASELVSDLLLTCTPTGPVTPASLLVNISLFLNTDLTSRIMNPLTLDTEALLLIDEPQPGVANISNGFPYFGQVLGTSGISAGAPGSGNVYQAKTIANNEVAWLGVPFVTGSPRTLRFTNTRANAAVLGPGLPVQTFVAVSGPISLGISGQPNVVAQTVDGLNFTSTVPPGPPAGLDLHFAEVFPNAFLKRIENSFLGPFTAVQQDVPGIIYCTQSGFTPEFAPLTPGAIGSANTGTRLLAQLSHIPPPASVLFVPDEITSTSGKLVAHRVFPPFAADFTGGTLLSGGGVSPVFPSPARTADVLYEVTAAAPFAGINGCAVPDTFDIHVSTSAPVALHAVKTKGHLAPVDGTPVASATAPEPRFVP